MPFDVVSPIVNVGKAVKENKDRKKLRHEEREFHGQIIDMEKEKLSLEKEKHKLYMEMHGATGGKLEMTGKESEKHKIATENILLEKEKLALTTEEVRLEKERLELEIRRIELEKLKLGLEVKASTKPPAVNPEDNSTGPEVKVSTKPPAIYSADKSTDLVDAVMAEDATMVTKALLGGADPNTTCSWATIKAAPVLCYAVADENIGVTRALLAAKDIQVDSRGDSPCTALLQAVGSGNVVITEDLLDRGADPNLCSGDPSSPPLCAAAHDGHVELCRLLLDRGADPHRTNSLGYHSIGAAAQENQKEVIKLILEYGGDPHRLMVLKSGNHRTPADIARINGHPDLAAWLSSQAQVSRR